MLPYRNYNNKLRILGLNVFNLFSVPYFKASHNEALVSEICIYS